MMKKKDLLPFFVLVISLVTILFSVFGKLNLFMITTDSGFDVGYSGGGSGGSYSGGGYSGGGSSGSSSDFSSLWALFWEFEYAGTIFMCMITIFIFLLIVYLNSKDKIFKDKVLMLLFTLGVFIILCIPFSIAILFLTFPFIGSSKSTKRKPITISKGLPKDEHVNKILDEGYSIFCGIQDAWMNFDYDKLRLLVSDELYNMYNNQLNTLKIKDQKNIMSDFKRIDMSLITDEEINEIRTIVMELQVSFYDYIVNKDNKVVRGKKNKKVEMLYRLTFVSNSAPITKCPNCGADIVDLETICKYCHSHLPIVSGKMKLAKKNVLSQK